MRYSIGDPVFAQGFGRGFVTHIAGAPDGDRTHTLVKPDGFESRRFRSAALSPAAHVPPFKVGSTVALYGGIGTIIARNGRTYSVEVLRPKKSGLLFRHLYPAVPDWRLALEDPHTKEQYNA
jgi:hypothetical protein